MSGEFQYFPGRVKISNVTITNGSDKADITELFKELNLNTSINSVSASAEILISDGVNFLHSWKPNAGDVVGVELGYKDETKLFSFKVISVNNIADFTRQRSYILNCVSHFYYDSLYKDVIGSFTGTTSSIAKGLFLENSEIDKINIWEESVGTQKLVIPRWSTIETIRWLARRSSWANDSVRMMFFQDSNLKYNFMPIEKAAVLYKDNPVFKYTYNQIASSKGQDQLPNSQDTYTAIKDITFNTDQFNIADAFAKRKINSVRYAPDIINKSYEPVGYNYFDSFSRDNYLNNFPQFNKFNYLDGKAQYDINTSFTHEDVSQINKVSDASNLKVSSIDNSQIIDITVVGNQAIDIGQVVEIDISSPEPASENREGKIDKRFSGKYYVYAKRDVFNEDTHNMSLGLVKESQLEG
jgi:hypothetical protein